MSPRPPAGKRTGPGPGPISFRRFYFPPGLLFLAVTGLLFSLPATAVHLPVDAERMRVDFTNRESRSISVHIGKVDGVDAGMNFAVLDSIGGEVVRFYPHEILQERFWSGPLHPDDYRRIRVGQPVVQIQLSPAESDSLREAFQKRQRALQEERRQRKMADIRERIAAIDEDLEDLRVDEFHLKEDINDYERDLAADRRAVQDDVNDLEDDLERLRDERKEREEERNEIQDRLVSLRRRTSPPADRIRDLEEDYAEISAQISDLNYEMQDLRDEIRVLRHSSDDLKERIGERKLELADVQAEMRLLEAERGTLIQDLEEMEKGTGR